MVLGTDVARWHVSASGGWLTPSADGRGCTAPQSFVCGVGCRFLPPTECWMTTDNGRSGQSIPKDTACFRPPKPHNRPRLDFLPGGNRRLASPCARLPQIPGYDSSENGFLRAEWSSVCPSAAVQRGCRMVGPWKKSGADDSCPTFDQSL